MARIELRHVSKSFGEVEVIRDVDLVCEDGALVVLVGPSGSGKSTLLRLVAGLERPDRGSVWVDGRQVDPAQPWMTGVAMVFEDDALYEHLTVEGNLGFPLRVAGAGKEAARDRAAKEASRLGIRRLLPRTPNQLSGGERGLTATGRALARDELRALLLDEPLAKADQQVRRRFRAELMRLHRQQRVTTLLATNDQEEAMALADVLAVMLDGRVGQVGPPLEVFEHPVSAQVAAFVGALPMNLFPAKLVAGDGGWMAVVGVDELALDVDLPGALDGARVTLGWHPHELSLAPAGTPFRRTLKICVGQVEDLGGSQIVRFGLGRTPGTGFTWRSDRPAAVRPGDRRELTWASDRVRIFDAATGETIPIRDRPKRPSH
jgi:ABC-type sugar transport system ATPase subunit